MNFNNIIKTFKNIVRYSMWKIKIRTFFFSSTQWWKKGIKPLLSKDKMVVNTIEQNSLWQKYDI